MTHPPLIYSASQLDQGFATYAVRGESLFFKVDDIVTYLIGTCNDETVVRETQHAMHQKGLHATVAFVLDVRGFNEIQSRLVLYQ